MRTVIVQGAVEEEIELLAEMLPGGKRTAQNGYAFYETTLEQLKIIISKTGMGILHACIATMLGAGTYRPDCIVNQGTAGAHIRELGIGDIVIGESAVYMNDMRSPAKEKGQGSNALEWVPGETGSCPLEGDPKLVRLAEKVPYCGNLLRGRLGSGDLFSRETDRIDLLHTQLGEVCEDMESAAVYTVCRTLNIPVVGIRMISNNELAGMRDNPEYFRIAHKKLQDYTYGYLRELALVYGEKTK